MDCTGYKQDIFIFINTVHLMYCILLALNFKCIINSNKVAPQCTPDLKDTDESYDVGR